MANIKRVRCTWSGSGVVGPAVTTFYFTATATGFPADLQTFFQALKAQWSTDITVTVPNTGDTISETNGTLQGVWTDAGGSTTSGTSNLTYVKGAGARVRWLTGGIHNDRRVIGTTFLTDMHSDTFDSDGLPGTTTVATILTAANALVSAVTPDMVIWSKPSSKVANDGESNAVVAAFVPREASWLRSRRV